VIELNRAVAVAMADGAERGLELVEALLAGGELASYQPAHAAHGELLRRLGRGEEASEALRRALALTSQEPERKLLRRRLEARGGPEGA
jgi:RNA polymerase sigma-70 factor (ECF subfamily)